MPPIAILVALADPTRCRIIEILRAGPQPVHQIANEFNISRPAISRHLAVLKQARLISEKKLGRENRYALHARRLKPVQDWLVGMTTTQQVANAPEVITAPVHKKLPQPAVAPRPVSSVTTQPPRERPSSQMGFDF